MSRPARARGLKHHHLGVRATAARVAPRTGAWIETFFPFFHARRPAVAPRTGAWIETRDIPSFYPVIYVAPRTGAWIETRET